MTSNASSTTSGGHRVSDAFHSWLACAVPLHVPCARREVERSLLQSMPSRSFDRPGVRPLHLVPSFAPGKASPHAATLPQARFSDLADSLLPVDASAGFPTAIPLL